MKNVLKLVCFLILFGNIACSKNSSNDFSTSKKYPVNFSISSFKEEISDINNNLTQSSAATITSDSLKSLFKYINYWVVLKNGSTKTLYHSIMQNNTNDSFGTFVDSLPYGSYSVYFAALGPNIVSPELNLPLESDARGFDTYQPGIYFSNDVGTGIYDFWISDCFVSNGDDINVTGDPINENIEMKRIVGLLDVKIEDAASNPGVEFRVEISKFGDHYSFYGDSTTILAAENSAELEQASNGEYIAYQPITDKPFDVTIYATIGSSIQSKVIKNVICYKNSKTILTGNFFSTGTQVDLTPSFVLQIDPTWSPDSTAINF